MLAILPQLKIGLVNFLSGAFTLGITFLIFAPIYLLAMNFWNAIDEADKSFVKNLIGGKLNLLDRFLKIKKNSDIKPLTTEN